MSCSRRSSSYKADEFNEKYKNSSLPAPYDYKDWYEAFSIETNDNGFIVRFWLPESDWGEEGLNRVCYEYIFAYQYICDTRRISFKPE